MHSIFKFTVSLLIAGCVVTSTKAQKAAADTVTVPLWQGLDVELDAVPLISNLFNEAGTYRYEAMARFNLKNKYYPVVEAGYEGKQELLYSGINFQGSGLFYRLGIDLNLIRSVSTQVANNKFIVGARLGMSDFSYDILNIPFNNPYTGLTSRIDYNGLTHTAFWFEIVAGIRIEILKNVMTGWTIRSKNPLGERRPGTTSPYYIPGYGKSGNGVWAFNYTIGYQF